MEVVILDSGPLGLLVHPRRRHEIERWLEGHLRRGAEVAIPEIALYELRRELLRLDLQAAVDRLDGLAGLLMYLPVTTPVMLRAAELWAQARRAGRPTADDRALDVDVILAATAQLTSDAMSEVVVATTNVGHLGRFVPAIHWREL